MQSLECLWISVRLEVFNFILLMKATKREAIVLEWRTLLHAISIAITQRKQFSRELWYMPSLLMYLFVVVCLMLSTYQKVEAPYLILDENSTLRAENKKLHSEVIECQTLRLVEPSLLPTGGSM